MASSAPRSGSASSVRADAISRLKRAASLPRMKDGRRPAIPANGGALTDGGRSEGSSQRGADTPTYGYAEGSGSQIDTPVMDRSREEELVGDEGNVLEQQDAVQMEEDLPTPLAPPEYVLLHHGGHDVSVPEPVMEAEVEGTVAEAQYAPEPPPADEHEEEYAEEQQDEPPNEIPAAQQLLLNLQQLQLQRALAGLQPAYSQSGYPAAFPPSAFPQSAFQTGLVSPQPQSYADLLLSALVNTAQQQPQQQRAFLPPTSPLGWQQPVTSPASPLPSLREIAAAHQRGLFRSNSAAARTEAYNKLTGGRDTPVASPPPSAMGNARLGRSNTVTGGERLAAGGRMVGMISRRQRQEDPTRAPSAMDLTTSAGEESSVSVTSREDRKRRRRRHSNQNQAKSVVDDRDVPTNAPSTPAAAVSPLPQDDIPPLPRPESLTSTEAANALRRSVERRHDSAQRLLAARNNFEYDYVDAREKQPTPMIPSKPATDVDTDQEGVAELQSPVVPQSPRPPSGARPLPSTPTGLPYPNPPFFPSQRGPHTSDAPSNASSGGFSELGIPVYFGTGSLKHDTFPVAIGDTPYSSPYKAPHSGENREGAHEPNGSLDASAAEGAWNLSGSEWREDMSNNIGRNLMDQIGDMGDDASEAEAETAPEPASPPPDSASTAVPANYMSPKSLPPIPASAPANMTTTPAQIPFPSVAEDARTSVSKSSKREALSEISFASGPPGSTPHRSRTESMGFSELESGMMTDGDMSGTGREEKSEKFKKPRKVTRSRSPSYFSGKVKTLLANMASMSSLRPRSNSVNSRAERKEPSESTHSSEKERPLLPTSRENTLIMSASAVSLPTQASAPASKSLMDVTNPMPEGTRSLFASASAPASKSLMDVTNPLPEGARSQLAPASAPASKALMDVTNPKPEGTRSPFAPASAAQLAKYTDDKLLPFPGMLRLEQERDRSAVKLPSFPGMLRYEQERDKFADKRPSFPGMLRLEEERDKIRNLDSTTSPTTPSFSPPPNSQDTIKASSLKIGTPSPGLSQSDLPAMPLSAPAGASSEKTLHYIDLPYNLMNGNPNELPTNRRGVQNWLRKNNKLPPPSGGIQKKSSLTDLLAFSMLPESGTEREDGTSIFGKLSLGRSLTKKSSRPKLQERQGSRPGTAPSALNSTASPSPAAAPVLALAPMPTSSSSTALATLAAAAAIPENPVANNTVLASLAAAAAISEQPKGSHTSLASSDPSQPNSRDTDPSGSALSTPSVSQETSSASQQSLDSPPLVQQPQLKDIKHTEPATTLPATIAPTSLESQPIPQSFALKPPPLRKLLLHTPVLQVVQGDRLTERHLFLFSDILVIARPAPRTPSPDDKTDLSSLSRPLLVKSIVEIRDLRIKPQHDDVDQAKSEKHRSTMRTFAEEFAEDPGAAVERLAQRAAIRDDPSAVADILFESSSLDKRQLGEYLCLRSSRHILRAFIDRFGFEEVRIDIALRTFLLSIILPDDDEGSDHLLNNFAARWWHANSRTIGFDRELCTRLVLAMIQLSDALHQSSYVSPSRNGAMSPTRPRITVHDWLETFRIRDPRQLVPELLLRAIYTGISRFRIAEALDSNSDSEVPAAMIPAKMKERLTHGEPSERISIRIPRPDRNFAIRLYGHGLKFDPEYLNFSNATEQSFAIFPTSVGQKTIIFGREGGNSAFYTGVPLSKTVLVERAFMKNTFQLAFVNHLGIKRKYLFSMDDPFRVTDWTTTLEREISKRKSADGTIRDRDGDRKAAADVVAFGTLLDTLLPEEEKDPNSSAADTSGTSLSRTSITRHATPKNARPGDRSFTGQQVIQICIQNSLLPGMLLRSKSTKAEGGASEPDKRSTTPRVASPLAMTPKPRPLRI